MHRFRRLPVAFAVLALSCGTVAPAWAHDPLPAPESRAAPGSGPAVDPAMDPVVRALVLALAARMLNEAARSPDPLAALGDSMERALASALRSPASARLFESLMAQALKDVPVELREPLALFAGSMLESMRREMLGERRPYTPY